MSDTKIYLGVEVGAASLKLALLDSAEKRVVKTAVLETETSPIDDVFTFESVLQQWVDDNQIEKIEAISVAVPAFRSIIRKVYVPSEASANIAEYLRWYLKQFTNAESDDAYVIDFKTLSGDNELGYTVLLIAVRREWVDALRKGFRSKALAPKSMEVDVLSIINLMDVGEKISEVTCIVKADYSGVTLMWIDRDNLLALRCVSTLSMMGRSGEEAYPILSKEILKQVELAKTENMVHAAKAKSIRLCGEMSADPLFIEAFTAAMEGYQITLMDSFAHLGLPMDDAGSNTVLSCVGAIGAALNVMEGAL